MLSTFLLGLSAIYLLYNFSTFVYLYVFHRSRLDRYQSTGGSQKRSWALVTGASDGIGKGFATQLCQRGFNVVIHGRNRTKLQNVAEDLERQYPHISVRVAVLNVYPITEEMVDGMLADLDDLDVTILINNVGGAGPVSPAFRDLEALSHGEIATLLAINISFTTMLTAKFLAKLRHRHLPALIINLGSITGSIPSPYLSVYAGTKAYIQSWSQSLACEMKAAGRDVEVMGLIVGEVAASWGPEKPTSFLRPSSFHFAGSALNRVGCGRRTLIPYIGHALAFAVIGRMPQWLADKILIGIAKQLKENEERVAAKKT